MRRLEREITSVRVDVLPQQRDLGDPITDQPLHLRDQRVGIATHLAPAGGGHDAVRANAVAANADLQPALEVPRTLDRKISRERFELEVPLGRQRLAGQELGQLVHLTRPERHIHVREALEHLLLDRLRPASADPDHRVRRPALERVRLAQMRDEAVIRLLPDRARVEQDQIGLSALRRLAVSKRLEHALHPLRVVLVHLAAECGQVIALSHARQFSGAAGESRQAEGSAWSGSSDLRRLPRVIDRARLPDHRDLDLARILELLFDGAGDLE